MTISKQKQKKLTPTISVVKTKYEVTVVLPCLNEAETLETCITKAQNSLTDLGVSGEVVVADNGSTDGSQDIANKLKARVVSVETRGYGSALLAGFKAANSKYIIMGDADDSYSLDQLGPFVGALRNGADLVMGNRFAGTIHPGAMPWLHRYVGNPVLSFLGRLFFRGHIRDFHCGMRGLNREKILQLDLHTTGMEFASELIVKSILANHSIVEVPTDLKPDGRSREPHLRTWRDGWRHLRFLLSYSPRWLFYYPGLLLAILGLTGFVSLIGNPRESFGIVFDLQSLIFSTFVLLCGTQMIWFAVLSKASSVSKGFMPKDHRWDRIFGLAQYERIYIIYFIVICIGLILLGLQVDEWISQSFGSLNPSSVVRNSLLGGSLVFLGFQALISHFLLSIILLGTEKVSIKIES
jgi:glycosyltransferase involved in cell wall biosynthesis